MKHIIGLALVALLGCGNNAMEPPPKRVFEGSLSVKTNSDVEDLFDYTDISGTLSVFNAELTALSLPHLITVEGGIRVISNSGLTAIEFPALISVGTRIDIHGNNSLASIEFPSLAFIGSALWIESNEALSNVECPELISVGTEPTDTEKTAFSVYRSELLTSLEFPKLTTAHSLLFGELLGLTSLELPSLVTVVGAFEIHTMPYLKPIDVPLLTSVGKLQLSSIFGPLGSFKFPSLTSIEYSLFLWNNGSLSTIEFPLLTSVGEILALLENRALSAFEFPELTSVGGKIAARENPELPQCLLDMLIAQLEATGGIGGEIAVHDNNEACTCEEVGGETVATCP